MADTIKYLFSKPLLLMLEQARTMKMRLAETSELALFSVKVPSINAGFITSFNEAIEAADNMPADDEVVTDQVLLTLDVKTIMEVSRRRIQRLFDYARLAFQNRANAARPFGKNKYGKARSNKLKLAKLLELGNKNAGKLAYKQPLLNAGYTQAQIDELLTLSQSLMAADTNQVVQITDRPDITQERRKKFNIVWGMMQTVNTASKIVFEGNFAKIKQYLLYPENGSDAPAFVVINELAGKTSGLVPDMPGGDNITADTTAVFSCRKRTGDISITFWWVDSDGFPQLPPSNAVTVNSSDNKKSPVIKLGNMNYSETCNNLKASNTGTDLGKYRIAAN